MLGIECAGAFACSSGRIARCGRRLPSNECGIDTDLAVEQ